MEMIQCPNCKKPISDLSSVCVHCGFDLKNEVKKTCGKCGTELSRNDTVCPKCGHPVEMTSQQTYQAPKDDSQNVVTYGRIVAVVLAIVTVIGVVAFTFSQKNGESYGEQFTFTVYSILASGTEAEECGNLIAKVWNNAIFEVRDSETDRYTRPNGVFAGDFNDALLNLMADSDFSERLNSIEESQIMIQALIHDLDDPPSGYKEAYEALLDLNDAYMELIELVINPSGSLKTYQNDLIAADNETADCYREVSIYLEE